MSDGTLQALLTELVHLRRRVERLETIENLNMAQVAAEYVPTLADGAVTTAKIADANVTYAKLIDQAAATVMGRASGAGTGDTTALTAAQLITILTGADGTGTLLDADLLDGLHATEVAASLFGATTTGGTLDWNHATNSKAGTGATLLQGTASNGPGGTEYYHALNFEYSTRDGSGNITQLAIPYAAGTNKMFVRGRYLGTWGSWIKVWTEGNDGTGSGLDADTVDGSHASAFAATSHTHGTSGIDDAAVTLAKLANQAQATVIGRAAAAGTGVPVALTAAQLIAVLATADGTGSGLDADQVDGYEASGLARLDSDNIFSKASPFQRMNSTGANESIELRLTETTSTIRGRLIYAGSNPATARYFGFLANADYYGMFADVVRIQNYAASSQMMYLSTTQMGLYTAAPTASLDVNGDVIRLRTAKTPASAAAAGNAGDLCADASYIYRCTATNTWKRVAIATW